MASPWVVGASLEGPLPLPVLLLLLLLLAAELVPVLRLRVPTMRLTLSPFLTDFMIATTRERLR